MPKEEIRYYWLRDESRKPVACIVSERSEGTLRFALAIHNPKDVFDKKMGRAVALARLRGKHARFVSEIPDAENIKMNLLRKLAFGRSLFGKDILPQRVRLAANYQWGVSLLKNQSGAPKKTE